MAATPTARSHRHPRTVARALKAAAFALAVAAHAACSAAPPDSTSRPPPNATTRRTAPTSPRQVAQTPPSPPAARATGRAALTAEAGRKRGALQTAVALSTAPPSPSRYGLADAGSEALLDQAMTRRSQAAPTAIAPRLRQFNVLRRALVDPTTGEVVLHGVLDPNLPTAALPYQAWLAEALATPEPVATLGQPDGVAVPARLDADLSRLGHDADFAKGWLARLIEPVLYRRPNLGNAELTQLDQRLSARLHIKPAQHAAYSAWHSRGKKAFADVQEYYLAREFMELLLRGAGCAPSTGRIVMAAQRALFESTPETGSDLYAQAGALAEFHDIAKRYRAGEITNPRAGALLAAAYGGPLLRGLRCPEARVQALVGAVRAGGSEDAMLEEINRLWALRTTEALITHVLHGFRFSSATLAAWYTLPMVRSPIDLRGGRRDSSLHRALFEADVALKYLVSASPSADLERFDAYLLATAPAGRLPRSGMNRFAIEPGHVVVAELKQANGLQFGASTLAIRASVLSTDGADATGLAAYHQALKAYADKLSAAQAQLAQAVPAIHAAREVAKVVALARWLRSKGVQAQLPTPAATLPLPESFEGFWGLTYLREPKGDVDTLMVSASGGVSFGPEVGDSWWQPTPAPQADADTLHQLAASAALAEKAAGAALAGDLEQARALAEWSAQAMTGQLDLARVPPMHLPEPIVGHSEQPGAVQAAIPMAALVVVERELAALRAPPPSAAADSAPAAPPAAAASRARLERLQTLLRRYRAQPVEGRALRVDLEALATPQVAVVAPTPPLTTSAAPAVTPPATAAPLATTVRPTATTPPATAPPVAPTAASTGLGAGDPELARHCRRAQAEAASLRAELQNLQGKLRTLNRSIQSDQAELQDWSDAAKRSVDDLRKRSWQLLWEATVLPSLQIGKAYCSKSGRHADRCSRQVAALGKLHETTKLSEWGGRNDKTWSYVLEGFKELLGTFLSDSPVARALTVAESLANSAYDVTEWALAFGAIDRLGANSEGFLAAVEFSAARMRYLVERLKAVEATDRCGGAGP